MLQAKDIVLRALEPEDLDFLFKIENNTSLWELSSTQTPFSKHILKQYLANAQQDIYEAKQLRLIIETDKQAIGMIDLFDFDPQHKRAGIGILIAEKYQSKGYATKAIELIIEYAFSVLDLHQLYANITKDNFKSRALFTKSGFKQIGVKKDWIFTKNQFKDEILFQLIKN